MLKYVIVHYSRQDRNFNKEKKNYQKTNQITPQL
jgi:hypothetical protein